MTNVFNIFKTVVIVPNDIALEIIQLGYLDPLDLDCLTSYNIPHPQPHVSFVPFQLPHEQLKKTSNFPHLDYHHYKHPRLLHCHHHIIFLLRLPHPCPLYAQK